MYIFLILKDLSQLKSRSPKGEIFVPSSSHIYLVSHILISSVARYSISLYIRFVIILIMEYNTY